jgi:hypothetical protein
LLSHGADFSEVSFGYKLSHASNHSRVINRASGRHFFPEQRRDPGSTILAAAASVRIESLLEARIGHAAVY